jgi:hypothetical protein
VLKFVSELWQVGGFLWLLRFHFDDWIENYWFVNICSFVLYNVNQSNIINDCDASKADHLFKMCNSKTCIENETSSILIDWFGFMLFNATLNSISVKS